MNYLINTNRLDNAVHEISYEQLKILYEDNHRETEESQKITASSYRGECFYTQGGNLNYEFDKEILLRDPKTAGTRIYYPHGIVLEQAARRNFYRGENQIFAESIPLLLRTLRKYSSLKEKELYRFVADMRIAEFRSFLNKFEHVQKWNCCDVLYETLAQHYGLETGWLDITDDFNIALFFATCFWDASSHEWKPLTKKQTEIDDKHRFGMIFHMPSWEMPMRWAHALPKFTIYSDYPTGKDNNGHCIYRKLDYPEYKGDVENLIYPVGFQPFMRCHMQSGYGIYMRTPHPLQYDVGFEKLKFRHSEELSQKVFDLMQGGELIYPHEGLKQAQFIIDGIAKATSFSEEAFQYALYRSHYFKTVDADAVRDDIQRFTIEGTPIVVSDRHPWRISPGRKKRIDSIYRSFSVEDWYGIKIIERPQIPQPDPMLEPWMLPEINDGEGVHDFHFRERLDCGDSIVPRNAISLLSMVKNAKPTDF